MKKIYCTVLFIRSLFIILAASFIGGCLHDDSDNPVTDHACALPCFSKTPTISANTLLSATGGTIDVTVVLKGELSNIQSVTVLLQNKTLLMPRVIGSGSVVLPTQASNKISIVVEPGAPADTYYPSFTISSKSPSNSGSLYYLDPTKSSDKYTYNEVVSGQSKVPVAVPFAIPFITVQ